jgi:folate-binding protein YgfZ
MAFYHLSDHSLIKISGKDAQTFLQGQLTCDVKQLTLTHQAQITAHCNRQGRIVSLFDIFYYQEAFYLILPSDIAEQTITALKKYSVFSKTAIESLYSTCYAGPKNQELSSLISIPMMYSDAAFYIDFTKNHSQQNTLTAEAWHSKRLDEKITRLHSTTISSFMPHEINLPELGGVSFNKGCFTGQEIVARFEHRSKLRYQLKTLDRLENHTFSLGSNIEVENTNGTLIDTVVAKGLISIKVKK